MHTCRQAVILAAGMGNRLGNISPDQPKSLIKFNGKTLLERNIESLTSIGVEEIIVVGGYKIEMLEPIINKYKNTILIQNFFYKEYETMQSMGVAESLIDKCFLQTEADFISEKKGFETLLTSSGNSIICSPRKKNTGVAVPIFHNGKFKKFSRSKEDIESEPYLNFVGPSHFTKDILINMKNHNKLNNNSLFYEEALSKAIHDDNFNLSFMYLHNFDYYDLNSEEDYLHVKELIDRLDGEVF